MYGSYGASSDTCTWAQGERAVRHASGPRHLWAQAPMAQAPMAQTPMGPGTYGPGTYGPGTYGPGTYGPRHLWPRHLWAATLRQARRLMTTVAPTADALGCDLTALGCDLARGVPLPRQHEAVQQYPRSYRGARAPSNQRQRPPLLLLLLLLLPLSPLSLLCRWPLNLLLLLGSAYQAVDGGGQHSPGCQWQWEAAWARPHPAPAPPPCCHAGWRAAQRPVCTAQLGAAAGHPRACLHLHCLLQRRCRCPRHRCWPRLLSWGRGVMRVLGCRG